MGATRDGTAARSRRGPYRKSRLVRARIVEAALQVFGRSGYRTGSLREIADLVGMSEAGLLHHYPSKSALLEAVLAHRDRRADARVHMGDDDDPLAVLVALVELARSDTTRPGVIQLYCVLSAEATAPDHPAHGFFVRRYATFRADLTRTFTALCATGRLRDGVDPGRAATELLALWDGLQLQWLLDRDSVDLPAHLAEHLHGVLGTRLPGW